MSSTLKVAIVIATINNNTNFFFSRTNLSKGTSKILDEVVWYCFKGHMKISQLGIDKVKLYAIFLMAHEK
jgi:hypothetical protein